MEKIKIFFKNNWQLILIFVLTFLIYIFFGFYINNGDPIASYGFSHAIRNGEVPYLDFNTISTPLYAFYSSLFLFICDEFMMFLLGQTILVTIMFYFLFEMFGNKAWIVFLSMIVFKFFGFNATYNFCCLVVSVIVLYLETKYPKKDFLIGVFLALTFLSKQTVGGLLLLPSLFICFNKPRKLLKRIVGFLVPFLIFIMYLISAGALFEFINLCFLGLFDFGGNNGNLFTIWFFASLVLLCFNILFIVKDRKVTDYYGLAYFGLAVPIFDLNHFVYYLVGFCIILLPHIKSLSNYKFFLIWGLILEFLVFNWLMGLRQYETMIYSDVKHFKYHYNYVVDYNQERMYDKVIERYKDVDFVLVMYYSMQYNISNERGISHFDVFLYGNHGYNGTENMIDKVSKMHDKYFIVSMKDYENAGTGNSQFNDKIVDYIISVSELVESDGDLNIYYKG